MPETSAKIIVIGAGIVGASIAWHLAKAGARVTVLAEEGGGRATPNSFAWINASWGNPEPYFRLRMRAIAEWRRLGADVPGAAPNWCGGLCWDLPPDELEAYAGQHESWGYGIRWVERSEIERIEPQLATVPERALHVAEEGAVEPAAAARALVAAAKAQGADVRQATVLRLVSGADGTLGVETTEGRLDADRVVLAAGAATADLAASLGVRVPLDTPPGLLVHSKPHRRLVNGLVIAPEAHLRQTADGRIVAGSDFGGGDPLGRPEAAAETLFACVRSMLRGSDDLALDFHTTGYRPTPADGFPILGAPRGEPRLYLAVTHSGVTLAPAIGLFAAEEILTGRRDPLLAPYGSERFD